MSDKYEFEFESGDRYYWESLMEELPDELDHLLNKHVYVSGWSFFGGDFEYSEEHEDMGEFEILKNQFLFGDENDEFGDIFTMEEAIENTDVVYNPILSKALRTMLEVGVSLFDHSQKYIEV